MTQSGDVAFQRTSEHVQREYGQEKWPSVERRIRELRASHPHPTLSRVVHTVAADQWRGNPLALRETVVDGALTSMPLAASLGAAQGLLMDVLEDSVEADTTLVAELGSGWGWHLLTFFTRGGPARAEYVAAEYTEAGRRAAAELAELDPDLSFRALPFDYHEPDLTAIGGHEHALVYSTHSLEQIPYVKPALFEAIRGVARRVTCVHLEPVGWQSHDGARQGTTRAYAEQHDYNRNLLGSIADEEAAGRIEVDLLRTEVVGVVSYNASTVIRWHAGG